MDLAHLLDIFLAEAQEYLASMEVALVAVERSSADGQLDEGALDELFRVAHSLKGMCGMMGYERMAALTHAMEDSLLEVRSGDASFDEGRLDLLLACVAGLEDALVAVGRSREEPETLEELARRVGSPGATPAQEAPAAPPPVRAEPDAPAPDTVVDGALDVRVTLAPDTELRGVRAFVVLRALGRVAEVLDAHPRDPVEFEGMEVRAWLRGAEPSSIRKALAGIPEISDVRIEEPPPAAAASPGSAPDRPAAAQPPRAEATLRVAASRLDELMFRMQEVVVSAARLGRLIDSTGSDAMRAGMAELSRDARQLQASMMHVRMTPLDTAFARIPRLVRDLAARLERDVELEIAGAETEVDRSMVEALFDPLVHLIRNALDHGIEPPAERVASGKPARARLRVTARHSAGHVVIELTDDGRGIDRDAIVGRAIELGHLTATEGERIQTQAQVQDLLCRPAVSTTREATDISGRGIGLDAVSSTVRRLGGRLEIESEPGRSTTIRLRLPMTLSIMPVLLVRSCSDDVAIPLDRVANVAIHAANRTRDVPGGRMLMRDAGPAIALLDLGTALGRGGGGDGAEHSYVVTVEGFEGQVALGVAQLHGTLDVATRPLPDTYQRDGAPLLGVGMLPDGGLATIIDCDRIAMMGPNAMEPTP